MNINKITIKSQVTDYIRQLILKGEIKPGDRIVPGDLAKQLKTGRGSIREALIHLEKEGIVNNIPYKGTYAIAITQKEASEICSIRSVLETFAITSYEKDINEKYIEVLRKIVDKMNQAAKNDDVKSIIKLDEKFHEYIIDKADNKTLHEIWSVTSSRISSIVYSVLMLNKSYSLEAMANNHLLIVENLERDRSLEEFKKIISKHYTNVLVELGYNELK